jgi:DNA-binding CsgD family transcriptional regulator
MTVQPTDRAPTDRSGDTLESEVRALVESMQALITTMDGLMEQIQVARVERDQAQRLLLDALAAALGGGRKQTERSGITPSQLRAARLYARTVSIRKTADELGIAEQTVKNHLASIRRRLGASNTAQALVMLGLPPEA